MITDEGGINTKGWEKVGRANSRKGATHKDETLRREL
jgi:hypothetical protein